MRELIVEILVNGESVQVDSYQFLNSIIKIIPEEDDRFQKLFEAAAKSSSKDVRCSVASREHLKENTLKLLLQDKETDVLTLLLNTDAVQEIVEYEDLSRMIDEIGSSDLLISIAENISDFKNCDPNWIAEKLISNADPSVRLALAYNIAMPAHILKRLLDDPDRSVRNEAIDTIESADWECDEEEEIIEIEEA